jgi:hypothetical protein
MYQKAFVAAIAFLTAAAPVVGSADSYGTADPIPGQVVVTFVNHHPSPATRVSFALVSHGVA